MSGPLLPKVYASQNCYILTDFFIIFMFFIFLNKNKASDQTASTGVRTQTYLQVLSYDNPRPFCQLNYTNLSKI